jgi:hypothetical protein
MEGRKVTEKRIDEEAGAFRTAPEGRAARLLVLPVLAMLMIFSGLILRWGLGPLVAVSMAVSLSVAAERLSQRGGPQAGRGQGWIPGLLRAVDLATRGEQDPDRGRSG